MKRLFAIMIAVLLVAALIIPAAALNDAQHVITITNTDSSVQHTYEAYRVFEGDLDTTDNVLSNIQWGNGVVPGSLMSALKATEDFADCEDAKDVAEVLVTYTNDSAKIDAFASIVGRNLRTPAGTSTETASPYTITVQGDGYYFVKDKNDTVTAEGESYSKYMLNVVHDVTIEAKDDHLVPEKKIIENDTPVSENTASIGDTINFQVQIDVPNMDGYKAYTLVMHDTLSKGLTYTDNMTITVGSETIDRNHYGVTAVVNDDGTTTLTVTFRNFIEHKGTQGKVTVKYTAVLNENAEIGNTGNPNTVKFTYSNNPASTGDGTGGDTGITPDSTTKTYVTKVDLLKVDGADTSKVLEGAKFQITGEGLNTVISTGTKFEAAPYTAQDGETVDPETYYLLDDGTYSTTAPDPAPAETYVLVHFTKVTTAAEAADYTATTGPDGKADFSGIKAGNYTLTELEAPDGYNLLDNPIDFTITWSPENGFNVSNNQSGIVKLDADGTFSLTIENNSGSILPHTGGIGTTLFMILGAILFIGAGVVLVSVVVSRKRENV